MKETRLKVFHLYILEKTNIISYQGFRVDEGFIIKEQLKEIWGAETILYLDFGSCTALCNCPNNCTMKRVNFISCKLKIKLKSF